MKLKMSKEVDLGKEPIGHLLLILALAPLQVLAEEWPGMDAFGLPEELPTPPFTDVSVHAWYYPYVRVQHTLGLMAGTGNDAFSPNGTVPLTQGLTVAVRVYEKYWGIPDTSAELGSPWYTYYINRAREYGILPQTLEGVSVFRAATRAELAEILSRSLPEVELEPIHQVDALPDYTSQDLYWNGVITLYRAGVLMGDDEAGQAFDISVLWKPQTRRTFDVEHFAKDNPEIDLSPYYKSSSFRRFSVTKMEEKVS